MNYTQRFKDMPIDSAWTNEKDRERFIKLISDLAFGENTIERGYSMEEVIEELEQFNEHSLLWDSVSDEDKEHYEGEFYERPAKEKLSA